MAVALASRREPSKAVVLATREALPNGARIVRGSWRVILSAQRDSTGA
jgi:hypothetical protein